MFRFEKHNSVTEVKLSPVERVVEFTPGGVDVADVARVLSLAVDGRVLAATAGEGFVDVEGRANFKLLYLDREGVPKGVDYNADFTVRLQGSVSAEDVVSASVSVVEADATAGNTLTLSAVVEVSATAVKRFDEECLEETEDCYCTMKRVTIPSLVSSKTVSVPVEDEVSAGEVSSVVFLDGSAEVTGATASDGVVSVDYAVYATVTYLEDGVLKTAEYEIAGSEEIADDKVSAGDEIVAEANLSNSRIVLAGVSGENIVRFEGDVIISFKAFRCAETEVVDDIFMLTNEMEISRTEREVCRRGAGRRYLEKVTGTVGIEDGEPVAVTAARCYLAKAVVDDGKALIEGVVTAELIFSDENGLNSVRAELPFSLTVGGGYENEIAAKAAVVSVGFKSKRGGEVELTAELGITVYEVVTASYEYVSEVAVGEEREVNTSGLSLYIAAEGDGLLEVCKALTATPEAVREQNPSLTLPLKEGDKVIYFRSLKV